MIISSTMLIWELRSREISNLPRWKEDQMLGPWPLGGRFYYHFRAQAKCKGFCLHLIPHWTAQQPWTRWLLLLKFDPWAHTSLHTSITKSSYLLTVSSVSPSDVSSFCPQISSLDLLTDDLHRFPYLLLSGWSFPETPSGPHPSPELLIEYVSQVS